MRILGPVPYKCFSTNLVGDLKAPKTVTDYYLLRHDTVCASISKESPTCKKTVGSSKVKVSLSP
jgi:hypothetical protein